MERTKAFQTFLKCDRVYEPKDISKVLDKVEPYLSMSPTNNAVQYYDVPCAFDIETTSFFQTSGTEDIKCAIMYVWMLGIFGLVIVGRTWDEYCTVMDIIADRLELHNKKRLCVYVHNLSYEFQFMRKHFSWCKVFAVDTRKPVYAVTTSGIEYRCSYILSGYSLEKVGENLQKYKVQKLVGNLDYSKIRHSNTPLTEAELNYCVNDVRVVMAYVMECAESSRGLARVPLTKTGYVRNYCRNSCFHDSAQGKKGYKRARYAELMRSLTVDVDEYKQLKRAFQGGFTHANPFYSGKVVENVVSYDFTSSYPAVMISERFPMGRAEVVKITSEDEFYRNLRYYCCMFDVEFEGLEPKIWNDNYISLSRCWGVQGAVTNNGRVVTANRLSTTVTEQDYAIIKTFYRWDKCRIWNFRRYIKDYLPTDFVRSILKLYADKTTLKGVEGKEVEYLQSKELLNSCSGMAVTDIVRDESVYDGDEWREPITPDFGEAIEKYNRNRGRFLFYPWGVWVTAYARRNLFTGVVEFGDDYVYSDTDSIKAINEDKHLEYIDRYNSAVKDKLYAAMDYHGLSRELVEPMTNKGVKKCLGLWDFDGHYSKFKTLGAKRYMLQYSDDSRNSPGNRGKINITVSGLNKKVCVPWMLDKWGDDVWEHFERNLHVPSGKTGKMTHTYIDDVREGFITDYLGNTSEYKELSAVHLGDADYTLSIAQEYADYITQVQDGIV